MSREVDDQAINEEYKIWKKSTPFLYDLVLTHALEWPSLTVQWLPDKYSSTSPHYSYHSVIIGTHAAENEPNYLVILDVKLPEEEAEVDGRQYEDSVGDYGGYCAGASKIDIAARFIHDGEVNRARYSPVDCSLIATKSPSADVYIFQDPYRAGKDTQQNAGSPIFRLKGHTREGFGLSWNNIQKGSILSGSDDECVCRWDIGVPGLGVNVEPLAIYKGHNGAVEDVSWHSKYESIFASVGEDSRLNIWDVRDKRLDKAAYTVEKAHTRGINSISFNPKHDHVFATGSSDNKAALWDIRRPQCSIHEFGGHQDEIVQVLWSPMNASILASCSADRRVNVWDFSRIGSKQSIEEDENGPPELLFIHGGHTSRVMEMSWNQNEQWMMVSTSEDNVMQIWQMTEGIYDEDVNEGNTGPVHN